jgi:hypothetical protein
LIVDVGDPEAFARGVLVSHAPGKKLARCRETIELQREFGTPVMHDLSSTQRRGNRPLQPNPIRTSDLEQSAFAQRTR